jgi:DNA transposition AAA+ family ATPase
MRPGLILTDNVKKGLFALAELKGRYGQASKRNMLVLEGLYGCGKTMFADHVYTNNAEMVYLEAHPIWSPAWFMRDVARVLDLPREHSTENNTRQVKEALGRGLRVLIIDEAHRLLSSLKLLESVQYLQDAGLLIVLITKPGDKTGWSAITQKSLGFADRVGGVVEFGPVSAEDIAATAEELGNMRLQPDLARFLQQQAGGNFRRAVKVLEELEIVCKANPGEITRGRVDQALRNLKLAEAREEKRVLKRAAAGGA